MKDYFDTAIWPLVERMERLMGIIHIPIVDQSTTQQVYVRQLCNHEYHAGECVKCRIVLEEFGPEEYDE